MHTYQGSVECCEKFADTYKKVTEKKYAKSDTQIYQILNQYGNEAKAIKIADAKLKEHINDGLLKPSEMCPCTTLHTLIREIKNKVADTQ